MTIWQSWTEGGDEVGFGEVADLMFSCFGFHSNLPAFGTWSGLKSKWAMLLTLNKTELTGDL